jgi:two-component system, cell cycle sensor histidine kinase and response regulator CckA
MSFTFEPVIIGTSEPIKAEVLNVNAFLVSVEKRLRVSLGENIDLELRTDAYPGDISANRTELEQLLMNLAVNARTAMPLGGRLTISTANLQIAAEDSKRIALENPGRYTCIAVSDTGSGMDQQNLSRLFEPSHTAKTQGDGSGLGLSNVYSIVKQAGGAIFAQSEPDRGTTFNIYWPQVPADIVISKRHDNSETVFNAKTLLVVEDNSPLLEITCKMLEVSGYNVIPAGSGEEAIQLAMAHAGPIDVMLTDLRMPKMSGFELSSRLHNVRPEMKVLFVSGSAEELFDDDESIDIADNQAFLQKPFTRQALIQKIREVCDPQSSRSLAISSELLSK